MKKTFFFFLLLTITATCIFPQPLKFRSGVFLHHSTGECIWGPNGSSTSVPQQMQIYNNNHGYTGTNAVTMNELWWPVEDDNEWCRWHRIFKNQDTGAIITLFYSSNRIIVIKSCFPSSNVEAWGVPGDTAYPDYKTVYNYKWHWRNIISIMRTHPQNFFVIWTNAPLVPNQTNSSEAYLSHCFCRWAKDTLAHGLDPVFGQFPQNVYVFDFFHKLAGSNWMLQLQYATGPDDSHPNASATALVAPQFVNEIFNASIAYETVYGIEEENEIVNDFRLYQNFPNPFNPVTKIRFDILKTSDVTLKIYDVLGKETAIPVNTRLKDGAYSIKFDGTHLPSGTYFYEMSAGNYREVKKMILMR